MTETFLVTGGSGFIGFHLCKALLNAGHRVIAYDITKDGDTYQTKRKEILQSFDLFTHYEGCLSERKKIEEIFQKYSVDKVCHLAAKTGVRNGGKGNDEYFTSNVEGFFNVLDLAKEYSVKNFVFSSSSSIYGGNQKIPFAVEDKSDMPYSFYAATKKSNELFAYSYSHLYDLPITILRLFTVYGPYGRHDMMMDIFCKKILAGESIDVHNHGKMKRDFTHVEDIVRGLIMALDNPQSFEIFNLGNDNPVSLEYMIELIEENLGIKAQKNYIEMENSEVIDTWADIQHTKNNLGWKPTISIEDGVKNVVEEYKKFHNL